MGIDASSLGLGALLGQIGPTPLTQQFGALGNYPAAFSGNTPNILSLFGPVPQINPFNTGFSPFGPISGGGNPFTMMGGMGGGNPFMGGMNPFGNYPAAFSGNTPNVLSLFGPVPQINPFGNPLSGPPILRLLMGIGGGMNPLGGGMNPFGMNGLF
jgi:hypothetical protein